MKRILGISAAILLVVGGLVAVLWPVETWRMYDANWKPLAMTEAEAYCAGFVLGEGNFTNKENPEGMEVCYTSSKYDNTVPRIGVAVRRFCEGLFATVGYPVGECENAVNGYDLWPLAVGGYTWEWNDSNPRPQIVQSDLGNAPRREGRNDDGRENVGRFGP
jgi:hypothetical protein